MDCDPEPPLTVPEKKVTFISRVHTQLMDHHQYIILAGTFLDASYVLSCRVRKHKLDYIKLGNAIAEIIAENVMHSSKFTNYSSGLNVSGLLAHLKFINQK